MLSDGRAADVGFDCVREENRCKEGNNALFAVDYRVARGQTNVGIYPRDSVDREIRRNGEKYVRKYSGARSDAAEIPWREVRRI
eukprot:891751-Prymnesium_polylepis.1